MWKVIDALAPIILEYNCGDIIEIGAGRSTAILAKHAQNFKVKLHSCDIKGTKQLFDNHIIHTCTSFEFLEHYNRYHAIVLLDGCHDYDVVKKEFTTLFATLINGGVIFMHDTLPPTPGHLRREKCSDVYKLRKELEADAQYNIYTWPYTANHCGLTMVSHKRTCAGDLV